MSTQSRSIRLRERIRRVGGRLSRNTEKLEALEAVDASDLRGPLKSVVERLIESNPNAFDGADRDGDGAIDSEELVAFARDKIDDLIEFGPIVEIVSDFGLDVIAFVAVYINRFAPQRSRSRSGPPIAREERGVATRQRLSLTDKRTRITPPKGLITWHK